MSTAQILDAVNQRFYTHHAEAFDRSRHSSWPGWHQCLEETPQRPLKILDLGCGNGRLIDFLQGPAREQHHRVVDSYVGLEREPSLLARAAQRAPQFECRFAEWSWHEPDVTPSAVTLSGFDWVVLFGVMHHIFGAEARSTLLRHAARLLRPGGCLSVSLWNFGDHPRFLKKTLDWKPYAALWGLKLEELEPNDYLLGFNGDVEYPRYCHWVNSSEEDRMVSTLNEDICLELQPGRQVGQHDDLNRYWCWTREAPTLSAVRSEALVSNN